MKAYGGVNVLIHIFLTSALVGGECPASRPDHFTPEKRASIIYWIWDWVGPRTGLDAVDVILDPTGTQKSDPSVVQPVTTNIS
jgi:hypothetical protein